MQTSLPSRAVLRLGGADVDTLLQGVITQDIRALATQPIIFSAMLSPQGKWQHDFFIHADGADRLIDIDRDHAEALLKKLKMYKLRSNVTLEDVSDAHHVEAAWGDMPTGEGWAPDPRLEAMGWRRVCASASAEPADEAAYHVHRYAQAVPEGARDASDRLFALELGYDQLHGVSFSKGCFVGQEPTARMHYRKILRKCLFLVQSEDVLPHCPADVMAQETKLGELVGGCAQHALALCRIDPVNQARDAGTAITVDGRLVTLRPPAYMQSKLEMLEQQQMQESES